VTEGEVLKAACALGWVHRLAELQKEGRVVGTVGGVVPCELLMITGSEWLPVGLRHEDFAEVPGTAICASAARLARVRTSFVLNRLTIFVRR